MIDTKTATIQDLQDEFVRLAVQLASINDQRRQILALIEQRKADASARERISFMTVIEKDAFKMALAEA